MNIYVIRKYVKAKSVKDAIKREPATTVHDCWLEEQSQKKMIEDLYTEPNKNQVGFNKN